jgi:hypothetical protein
MSDGPDESRQLTVGYGLRTLRQTRVRLPALKPEPAPALMAVVMGVQPDVHVGLRSTDGPHRQGMRVAEKLPEAVARAIRAGDWSVHLP